MPGDPLGPLKASIHGLRDSDGATRAGAAREIFDRGRQLARSAVENWLEDAALANCFVLDCSRFPETTVGLAVAPSNFELIWQACGRPRLADVPPDQDAREFELDFPEGVRLDILTTREPAGGGAIARHLEKFGESIQQVELLVRSVDQATRLLCSRLALVPVFAQTREGANATRVNFFLVPAREGKKVLIELVEPTVPAGGLC